MRVISLFLLVICVVAFGCTPEKKEFLGDARIKYAIECGLIPETATWHDIEECNFEQMRKESAKRLGLPETATYEEISELKQALDRAKTEIERRKYAKILDLDIKDATWREINDLKLDIFPRDAAMKAGVDPASLDSESPEWTWIIPKYPYIKKPSS